MINRFYEIDLEHAPLVAARMSSIKIALDTYAMVGKKFTLAELEEAFDDALETLPAWLERRKKRQESQQQH